MRGGPHLPTHGGGVAGLAMAKVTNITRKADATLRMNFMVEMNEVPVKFPILYILIQPSPDLAKYRRR